MWKSDNEPPPKPLTLSSICCKALYLNDEDAANSTHECEFEDPTVYLVGLLTEEKKRWPLSWSPGGVIKPSETGGQLTETGEALTVEASIRIFG